MGRQKLFCLGFDEVIVIDNLHLVFSAGLRPLQKSIQPRFSGPGVIVEQADGSFNFYRKTQQNKFREQITNALTAEVHEHFISNLKAWKNPLALGHAMIQILESGHHIAITSFNAYPEIIKPILRGILTYAYFTAFDLSSLTQIEVGKRINQLLTQIFVLGGQDENGKIDHIQIAMNHFGVQDNHNVIMLDHTAEMAFYKQAKQKFPVKLVAVPFEKTATPEAYIKAMLDFMQENPAPEITVPLVEKTPSIYKQCWSKFLAFLKNGYALLLVGWQLVTRRKTVNKSGSQNALAPEQRDESPSQSFMVASGALRVSAESNNGSELVARINFGDETESSDAIKRSLHTTLSALQSSSNATPLTARLSINDVEDATSINLKKRS